MVSEKKAKKEDDRALIVLGLLGMGGVAAYLLYGQGKCTAGQTRTRKCPDGSTIITHTCVNGFFKPTGKTCGVSSGGQIVSFTVS
jgi:hypothetical protein